MEEEYASKELSDYIDAFRRRKVSISVIATSIFIISLVIALVWPPTYKSTATILIEGQEIPSDLVRSTITSFANQRIQTIKARVMTRNNLMEIIKNYHLYVDDLKRKTTEEVLENMREDINIQTINASVIDPQSGRPGEATIAFTLSYKGDNPGSTQKVANELTTLYLSENLRERKDKSKETYVFLTTEAEKLAVTINDFESKMATFKEKNAESLPEMMSMNLRIIERSEENLVDIKTKLHTLEERKFYLENQLSQIDPVGSTQSATTGQIYLAPSLQLKSMERELEMMLTRYHEEHPDVIKTKREIEALKKLVDTKNIEKTEGESQEFTNAQNPAYISIQSQLAGVNSEIKSLIEQREGLNARLIDYEKRMVDSPNVEKEFRTLVRGYNSALARYQEIKAKQMAAEIGKELESESKGERFSLIEPPQFPEKPISPNRPAIIFLGFILSLAGGLGFASIAESLSKAVRGVKQATLVIGTAPLSIIPTMMNEYDIVREIQVRKITIVVMVTGVLLTMLAIHFLFSPLDVLWFRGIRKVDSIIGS